MWGSNGGFYNPADFNGMNGYTIMFDIDFVPLQYLG
jgi:hypothetical protein